MKELFCAKCGILTARMEAGSTIKKNAIMICDDCNDDSYVNDIFDNPLLDSNSLDSLKNIFGMK
jgi:hypothetical protein